MTLRSLVHKVNKHKPTTPEDFMDVTGAELIELDQGCFREAYAVAGKRVVVKFLLNPEAKSHPRREIRRVREILRKKTLRHLRRYVPKFYYMDYSSGVVMMEELNRVGKVSEDTGAVVEKIFEDTFRRGCADTNYTNLGYDGRGQIKVLDLGGV